jgi:hypothetical protein
VSRSQDTTRRLCVLLSLAWLPALCASTSAPPLPAAPLRPVESSEGRFRAALPSRLPRPERRSRPTLLGTVHEVHYVLAWGEGRVSLEFYDLPRLATLIVPAGLLLEQAADGVVADMRARELERISLERQAHPARLVTYVLPGEPGAVERALIVLAGSRLYMVVVTSPPGAGLEPELDRIVDSFEIFER